MTGIPLESVGPPMACDVCGCRLNNFEWWQGDKLESITWKHTGLLPEGVADHEPVPVLLDPDVMPRVGFCDFCSSEKPEWSYPCAPFQAAVAERRNPAGGTDTLGWGSCDNWAACAECHADIEAGNWESVEKRSISHKAVPKMYRSAIRADVRGLHRLFRLNRLGPPFRTRKSES